jgi:2-oxoglutarate dehydrogenase E1 component
MSNLPAYNIGGIIHLIINNQIGFTANPRDARKSRYATEFAKIISAPIFHVNGDDIESILRISEIAVRYRQKWNKDVIIDIVCYRKYGHNEGDEPMYSQGPMYNIIKEKQTPASLYANDLIKKNIISTNYLSQLKEEFKQKLDLEYVLAQNYTPLIQSFEGLWKGYVRSIDANEPIKTGVDITLLRDLGLKLCNIPNGFHLNKKLEKLFDNRVKALEANEPLDWATGEALAFATLLNENISIRFTGQDCERGTFSHRHSVLRSQIDNEYYIPLNHLSKNQAFYYVANSNLSEYGVLGFEYGYSLVNPKNLVIWEAQFGDFANGAQIIFDQFIVSSEAKWLRASGIVVLLPHGFEGQGPEHSSARLERFLQSAANDNIIIAYPTTPASFFHLLRRQIHAPYRKPLIVMTPKSLLRHKRASSMLIDFTDNSSFLPILDEIDSHVTQNIVKRVIFCSGKIYFDLLEMRIEQNINNICIIRLEQLYPFSQEEISKILAKYGSVTDFVWCQEEPKNMGAWNFVQSRLNDSLQQNNINFKLRYIGRGESAAPATGSLYAHNKQQEALIKEALIVI